MAIVVQRSFIIERGAFAEFERLSREFIWPYMEARGCKILGLYTNLHGGPSDEVILNTAYASLAHWEGTRMDLVPDEAPEQIREMAARSADAIRQRHKLTKVSSTRVFELATNWIDYGVREVI